MLFQLIQIVYWLALSTWFGSVLFIALAAPIIFRVVRRNDPILPSVLSVNLEGQHGTLLAGEIVGTLLTRLSLVQAICAVAMGVSLIAQFFLIDLTGSNLTAAGVRVVLFVIAMAIVLYNWWVSWPRIWKYRQEYIDHADEPEIANPAKEKFDREHHRSEAMFQAMLFLVLGIILFSANITPRHEAKPVEPTASRMIR